jgi:chromosome segregation ATPase
MTILSYNQRIIQDLKKQVSDQTKALKSANERARDAEGRADRAEFSERECTIALRKLRQRVDELEAALKSRGVEA